MSKTTLPSGDNSTLREATALREIGWFELFLARELSYCYWLAQDPRLYLGLHSDHVLYHHCPGCPFNHTASDPQ